MIDPLRDIDWGAEWIQRQADRKEPDHPDIWNERAKDYGQAVGHSSYAETFIEFMGLSGAESILDIGSGPGTLAIPLAELGHSVTAADFSQGMLDELNKRIDGTDLDIRTVRAAWEDDWAAAGIRSHDIVIASRSTMVADLSQAIDTLNSFAKKRVCMTLVANFSPRTDDHLLQAIGRPLTFGYDYIYALMMLHQKGFAADLRFILSEKYDRYTSPEEAYERSAENLKDLTEPEALAIREYLDAHLVYAPTEHETRPYRKDYKRFVRWAFISWDLTDSGRLWSR